jgi:hypothetical protein
MYPSRLPARRAYSSERGVLWVIPFTGSVQVFRQRQIRIRQLVTTENLLEQIRNPGGRILTDLRFFFRKH